MSHGRTQTHKTHHGLDLGKPPPSPYSILCASPRGPHPNGFLSLPKFPKLGFPQLCRAITLCVDLWSRWSLKQSCNPCRELSNSMSHTTYTQGNQVDSWLLVVGSQTTNLAPGLSFGHNLCLWCLNGSREPILDIYVSISFQWYKGILQCNGFWLLQSSTWECGCPFSHSPTLPISFLARALTNLCLGCKPKARVATLKMPQSYNSHHMGMCFDFSFVIRCIRVLVIFEKDEIYIIESVDMIILKKITFFNQNINWWVFACTSYYIIIFI